MQTHASTTLKDHFGSLKLFSNRRISINYYGKFFDGPFYGVPRETAAFRSLGFARDVGVTGDVMMPDVRPSNARIETKDSFERPSGRRFLAGVEADGVVVSIGDAAIFSTRDCPTVIMCCPDGHYAVAAHASRQSLLGDFGNLDGHGIRQSVIYAMASKFSAAERERVEVAVVLAIAAEHFEHNPHDQEFGEKNRAMIHFVSTSYGLDCFDDVTTGRLSLFRLIQAQCKKLHIDPAQVRSDGFDTYSTRITTDDGKEGRYAFYSHRRGDLVGGNLVLVAMSGSVF